MCSSANRSTVFKNTLDTQASASSIHVAVHARTRLSTTLSMQSVQVLFLDVTGEMSEESSVAKHRLSATDEWSHSSEMATASFRISWSELRVSDGKRTRRIQDMSPLTLSPYRDHVTDAGSGALRLGLHYFSGSPMKRGNNVVFPICASRSLTPHCGVSSSTIRSHHLLFYSTGTSNHQSY
jgi:hypothetical protein